MPVWLDAYQLLIAEISSGQAMRIPPPIGTALRALKRTLIGGNSNNFNGLGELLGLRFAIPQRIDDQPFIAKLAHMKVIDEPRRF